MPLYEYLCEACGRRSEVLQKLHEPPLTACPHCGGAVKKQHSAPSFQFKGTGWYVTDYAKKGSGAESPKAAGGEKSEPAAPATEGKSAAEPAGESKSEPKSDAKAESKRASPGDSST